VEQCIALLLQSLSSPGAAPINQIANETFTKSPGSSPSTPPPDVAEPSDSEINEDPPTEHKVEEDEEEAPPEQEKPAEEKAKEPNPLVINVSALFMCGKYP
jgi:hypothetical protein